MTSGSLDETLPKISLTGARWLGLHLQPLTPSVMRDRLRDEVTHGRNT